MNYLLCSLLNALFLLPIAEILAHGNVSGSANSTNTTQPTGPVTTDAMCGPDHNNTICVLDGIAPCCSENGFCGGDKRYCSTGCQPLFGSCVPPNSSTLGNPACSWARQGDSPRCDGQCGTDFDGALCDASAAPDAFAAIGVFNYGPCCSKDGFCGNTSAHCESAQGCQSGCWGGEAVSSGAAKGTVSVSTVTVTGSAAGAATSTGAAVGRGRVKCMGVLGLGFLGVVIGV